MCGMISGSSQTTKVKKPKLVPVMPLYHTSYGWQTLVGILWLAHFGWHTLSTIPARKTKAPRGEQMLLDVIKGNVKKAQKRVNRRKAAGPDSFSGCALRGRTDQLVGIFTHILSLVQVPVLSCAKSTSSIPVPKNTSQ